MAHSKAVIDSCKIVKSFLRDALGYNTLRVSKKIKYLIESIYLSANSSRKQANSELE